MSNDVLKAAILAGLVGAMEEDSSNEDGNKCEIKKGKLVSFDNPVAAREHMIRLARLEKGDVIFGKYEDGSEFWAVFVDWQDGYAFCIFFSPEDGGQIGRKMMPVSVIWGVKE